MLLLQTLTYGLVAVNSITNWFSKKIHFFSKTEYKHVIRRLLVESNCITYTRFNYKGKRQIRSSIPPTNLRFHARFTGYWKQKEFLTVAAWHKNSIYYKHLVKKITVLAMIWLPEKTVWYLNPRKLVRLYYVTI